MTLPKQHLPGQVSLLTRRCTQGHYFLRPDETINHVIPYEIAKACERHGQIIHGAMALSNHTHQVSTDTTGNRGAFMLDAMSGIARARNRDLGRRGHFWSSTGYGDTVLLDIESIERKLLYTWLTPVKAGLVNRARDWPGFKILPDDWGRMIRVDKPDDLYGGHSPEVVEFTPQPPPGYDDADLDAVKAHFNALVRRAEEAIHRERKSKEMCRFVGRQALLANSPFGQPDEDVPFGKLNPRFTSRKRRAVRPGPEPALSFPGGLRDKEPVMAVRESR